MPKLKAVLFDYDGVLRDTTELLYASLEKAFATLGRPVPTRAELKPHMHHHKHIHKQFADDIELEEFEKVYLENIYEMLPDVPLYDGAEVALAQLKNEYRLGIVSSANGAAAELEQQGIAPYFDCIVGGLDTIEHKPHGAPVLRALDMLKLTADEAIMIGDLPTDIMAARVAGLRATIGITTGLGDEQELREAGADYVIGSLAELLTVIERLEHAKA